MAEEFSIEVNGAQVLSAMEKLKDFSGIAENDATKTATKALQGYLVETAKKTVNMKVGRIKKGLKVNVRGGKITISARAPTLFQFLTPAKQKALTGGMYREEGKKGLKIRYFKGRPLAQIDGSFLIRGNNGNRLVVRRKDKNNPRSKLEALYGRWIRDLWEVPSFKEGTDFITTTTFQDRFTATFDKLKRTTF